MTTTITLATFAGAPPCTPRGMRFTNAWAASESYSANRRATLTGQYPQREATTRISDVFAAAGWHVTEGTDVDGPTFRLWEEPQHLDVDGVLAVATGLGGGPCELYASWPGVAEDGDNAELVSPLDLAPTLAAIAGLDVRPNAALSFDGLNLVPVLRYGASGHAALFFDNGIRTQNAWLADDRVSDEAHRADLTSQWEMWKQFMGYGPLQ